MPSIERIIPEAGDHRRQGFTLMEMVVVIVIMGLLFSVVLPSLEGISPKYRLRSGARELGSKINQLRSLAGATGKTFALHYDLEEQRFWMIMPPGADEDPDLPLEDREFGVKIDLPDHVEITEIILADGTSISGGELDVVFDPIGNEGSHIAYLRNNDDQLIAIKFNSLLGYVDYFDTEVKFERYQ